MYYKQASGPGGPGQTAHKAYSAISQDGVNFKIEGLRLESEGTIDRGWVSVPEVVRTFDGRWRMYYVSARDTIANVIASAISGDGLNFVREEGIRVEGMVDPAVVKLPNGQYWLFGMVGLGKPGSQLVIRSATSADGLRFIMDDGVVLRSGGPNDSRGLFDPTVTALPEGRYRMYYGGDDGKTLSTTGVREDNPRVGSAEASSAADRRNTVLAPGSFAALYGTRMTTDPAKTIVEVNGQRAAVSYASDAQINFIVPETVKYGAAHIIVTSPSGRQTTALALVTQVSPALFTRNASGSGEAAAVDAVRRSTGPFVVGADDNQIALLGTGIRHAKNVVVTVGGVAVEVLSAGPEGRSEGLDQVVIRIPPGFTPRGALPLELTADGHATGKGVTLTLTN